MLKGVDRRVDNRTNPDFFVRWSGNRLAQFSSEPMLFRTEVPNRGLA